MRTSPFGATSSQGSFQKIRLAMDSGVNISGLSPMAVDAKVRLRSGRDNRDYIRLPGVGTTEAERKRRGQPTTLSEA
jgi:hypothetical protein